MEIDLDQFRAARAEERGDDPHFLLFHGEKFELPAEAPADFVVYLAMGNAKLALAELLGAEAPEGEDDSPYDRFWKLGPSVDDLEVLVEQLEKVYGTEERHSKKKKAGN